MKIKSYFQLAAVLSVVFLTAGCISYQSSKNPQEPTATTLGQELMDLQAAKDRGVLTDEEYERERQELLNNND